MRNAPGTSHPVLVTGATGYLGSRLVAGLISDGIDVHIIHRPDSSFDQLANIRGQLTCHADDGTDSVLNTIFAQVRPDSVYHLASQYVAEHWPSDIGPLINSNILFGTRIFDAMANNRCRRIVVVGTSWQHFSDYDLTPATLYAATKSAQETIASYFATARGLSVGSLLMTDTYGPHDPRRKLFFNLRHAVRTGERLAMSPGEQVLDMVYVDDAVAAIRTANKALGGLPPGKMHKWLVQPMMRYSLRQIVAIWENVVGCRAPIDWGKRPYRAREVMQPWQRGAAVPGWSPLVSLERGISLMEQSHDWH